MRDVARIFTHLALLAITAGFALFHFYLNRPAPAATTADIPYCLSRSFGLYVPCRYVRHPDIRV